MVMPIRKCSWCKTKFDTESAEARNAPRVYKYCGYECQNDHAISMMHKQATKRKERAAKGLPPKKTKTSSSLGDKGLSHHWAITKKVMQKYAKLRDLHNNYPCIACNKHHLKTYMTTGSMPTGGHYKSGGANKNLQFNLWNINFEHNYCNSFDSDHLSNMGQNIADRYGAERLDFLESNPEYNRDHSDKKYLARMRKIFNKRMKRYI